MTYPQLQDADWLRDQYLTQNKTPNEIRAIVGCSQPAVYSALSRAGIQVRGARGPARRYHYTREELRRAYQQAESAKAAAEALGMSLVLYRRRCREVGLDPGEYLDANRRGGRPPSPRPSGPDLLDLHRTHGTWKAVAAALGVNASTVRTWAVGAGVTKGRSGAGGERVSEEPIEARIVLPAEVFDRLAAELDEPARPIPALTRLIERPRRVQLQQDDGEVTG